MIIDKVYIYEPCGSQTLAGVLLARFDRVSHVTHFYKYKQYVYSTVGLLDFQTQYDCTRELPGYKKCSAKDVSFYLLISNSHCPSMYT